MSPRRFGSWKSNAVCVVTCRTSVLRLWTGPKAGSKSKAISTVKASQRLSDFINIIPMKSSLSWIKHGFKHTREFKVEKRVKIFSNRWPFDLEKDINIFLESTLGKVHEIRFSETALIGHPNFHAYVTFTPEIKDEQRREEEEKKQDCQSVGRVQSRPASFWKQNGPPC